MEHYLSRNTLGIFAKTLQFKRDSIVVKSQAHKPLKEINRRVRKNKTKDAVNPTLGEDNISQRHKVVPLPPGGAIDDPLAHRHPLVRLTHVRAELLVSAIQDSSPIQSTPYSESHKSQLCGQICVRCCTIHYSPYRVTVKHILFRAPSAFLSPLIAIVLSMNVWTFVLFWLAVIVSTIFIKGHCPVPAMVYWTIELVNWLTVIHPYTYFLFFNYSW